MRSAFRKAMVGVAVGLGVLVALLAPGLMGERQPTELATRPGAVPAAPVTESPTAVPTEITLPSPTAVVPTATPIPATSIPPAATPTVAPTAVVVAVATTQPTAEPTPEPEPTIALPTATALPATPVPTEEPTPEPTVEPTPEPTAEPTPEPTAEPTPTPTAEPTPTVEVEPTPTPTAEPTPTATATVAPDSSLQVAASWMYVTATDGLFLRDVPGGQIVNVLTYRSEIHLTGKVESSGERLWAEVDLPEAGWVAIAYLSAEEPEPPANSGPSRPDEPPTAADWAALRNCESGGRYGVVDPSGLYHGAYQFLPSTWDGLARRFWPELVGVLPSQAAPADQDKMAQKLFDLEGARPWPTCGRHLL